MQEIDDYLSDRMLIYGQKIQPLPFDIFTNLAACHAHNTRVVIVSDYPYAEDGMATGRALDITEHRGYDIPSPLRNMHRELRRNFKLPKDKKLRNSFFYYASQGVLLLNSVWTCEPNKPEAHKDIGWQTFTTSVINYLAERELPTVFILLGDEAKRYKNLINDKHLVIETSHPRAATAGQGFMFSSIFTRTNDFLRETNRGPIDWLAISQDRYGLL